MTVSKTDLAAYCDRGNIWSTAAAEMPFLVYIILIDSGASMGPNFFGPRASLSFWYQAFKLRFFSPLFATFVYRASLKCESLARATVLSLDLRARA